MLAAGDGARDVVVVLPGILGSTLAKDGKLVWAPSAGSVVRAVRTLGHSVKDLELPEGLGDADPCDGVVPVGLMPDLHVLPGIWTAHLGYSALVDWLESRFGLVRESPGAPDRIPDLLSVPYDWRLSNRLSALRVREVVEPALERWRAQGAEYAEGKLIFVCHSMGGLVARWYIEMLGGAEVTRKLITLGTPYRGALKALDQLVNGVRKGIGPIGLNLTALCRSMPSAYQLLPEYACVEAPSGLAKTTEAALPALAGLSGQMVADGMRFHDDLDAAAASGRSSAVAVHPLVGFRQPTATTARIGGDALEVIETIGGADEGGDATVPRLSAAPKSLPPDSPQLHPVPEHHGALQSNGAVMDWLEGVLSASPVVHKAPALVTLSVRADQLVAAGETVNVVARAGEGRRVALEAAVSDEVHRRLSTVRLTGSSEGYRARLGPLPPGLYTISVSGVGSLAAQVAPVTATTLVWDPGDS